MDISGSILETKRANEWRFLAAMFGEPSALPGYSWMPADVFSDALGREFWATYTASSNPVESALKVGAMDKILSTLSDPNLSTMYAREYAQSILDDAYLLDIAGETSRLAQKIGKRDIDGVREIVSGMAERQPKRKSEYPDFCDAGMEFISLLNEQRRAIKTGFEGLDRATGGLERQTLTIIGARPSMGKTAMGWQMAEAVAEAGEKALYISLEMSKASLIARRVCGKAGVTWRDVISGRISQEQKDNLRDHTENMIDKLQGGVVILDDGQMTTSDIWRAVSEIKPDLVVVDHLSLVGDRADNERFRLGGVSWGGKQIAKKFDCATVYICQLNRANTKRENKRPTLEDLEESGRIEQNADNVLFLHREDYYQEQEQGSDTSQAEIWIEKFRNGQRHIRVNAMYNLKHQWFYPVAYR